MHIIKYIVYSLIITDITTDITAIATTTIIPITILQTISLMACPATTPRTAIINETIVSVTITHGGYFSIMCDLRLTYIITIYIRYSKHIYSNFIRIYI